MGAALTYARRYALFTLVGIAGEDDLDAPDLAIEPSTSTQRQLEKQNENGNRGESTMSAVRSKSKRNATPSASVLSAENSETVRDRLVKEISTLPSADDALAWALRKLG